MQRKHCLNVPPLIMPQSCMQGRERLTAFVQRVPGRTEIRFSFLNAFALMEGIALLVLGRFPSLKDKDWRVGLAQTCAVCVQAS